MGLQDDWHTICTLCKIKGLFDDIDFRDLNRQTLFHFFDFQRLKSRLISAKYPAYSYFNATKRSQIDLKSNSGTNRCSFRCLILEKTWYRDWNRFRLHLEQLVPINIHLVQLFPINPFPIVSIVFEIMFVICKDRCCVSISSSVATTFVDFNLENRQCRTLQLS